MCSTPFDAVKEYPGWMDGWMEHRGTREVENDRKSYRNAWAAAERAERFRPKEPSRPANGPFGRSLIYPSKLEAQTDLSLFPPIITASPRLHGTKSPKGEGRCQEKCRVCHYSPSCPLDANADAHVTKCLFGSIYIFRFVICQIMPMKYVLHTYRM